MNEILALAFAGVVLTILAIGSYFLFALVLDPIPAAVAAVVLWSH